MNKTFTTMLILVLFFGNLFAQQPKTSTIKQPEISAELRKNAVDFLRQTIKEIPNLKAEENRQYFTIETARLLWKYDDKESRKMFEGVMQEVKTSIAKTVEKYIKAVEEAKKARVNANVNYDYSNTANTSARVFSSNRTYGNMANSKNYVESEISAYDVGMVEEFGKIESLRKRLIIDLTDIEPNLAYQFLTETNQMTPEGLRDGHKDYPRNYERRIVDKLLERDEIDNSILIARSVFAKDFSTGFINILSAIYKKDALKGSQLAEETLQKLKIFQDNETSINSLVSFFDTVFENKQQKQPLLSEKSLRELAKFVGQQTLISMNKDFYFNPYNYAKKIKEYAPREALKILQKANQMRKTNSPIYANKMGDEGSAAYTMMKAANAAMVANKAANASANTKKTNSKPTKLSENIDPILPDEFEQTIETKSDLIQKLQIGKFTDEERKEGIILAKEYALAENYYGYARPDRFLRVVGELARFSLFSADKEVADELMKEAEVYVRPETKNYIDYAGKLLLAGGYSSHHPEKSFALMESMVTINDVIESAVKFGVFFDVELNLILGDEVSALFFLGDRGGIGNLTKEAEFRMFIQNLSKADFKRTKGLADKFEKGEIKMAAKILILQTLLGESKEFESGYVGY